jgi:hypothetical protein
MARQYYKDSTTGQMKPIGVKVEDTLPVGFEGEIADGTPIPEGWVQVDEIYGIVESGSNTNGNYIKYGDGTLICTKRINTTITALSQWGSLYDANVDGGYFPYAFQNSPTITAVLSQGSGFIEKVSCDYEKIPTITVARPNSSTTWGITIDIIAIGKWK